MKIQRTEFTSAGRSYGVAVLLRSIDPIGKSIVGDNMIKLAGGLVVPGTPRFTGTARDDGALIAAHDHSQRLVGIDPQFVIVVAAGSALPRVEGDAAVGRFVGGGVRDVHCIGIFGIDAEFTEIPAALPDAAVVRNTLPVLRAIVGTV